MGAPVICFVHGRQQLWPGPFPTNAMISDCLTSTTTDFDARQQLWLLFIHPLSGSSTHVSFGGVHACLHCAHSTCNLAAETTNNRPLHYITYHFVRLAAWCPIWQLCFRGSPCYQLNSLL